MSLLCHNKLTEMLIAPKQIALNWDKNLSSLGFQVTILREYSICNHDDQCIYHLKSGKIIFENKYVNVAAHIGPSSVINNLSPLTGHFCILVMAKEQIVFNKVNAILKSLGCSTCVP